MVCLSVFTQHHFRSCMLISSLALHALELVNEALSSGDAKELLKVLQMPHLGLREVKDENAEFYLGRVTEARDFKKVCGKSIFLPNKYVFLT